MSRRNRRTAAAAPGLGDMPSAALHGIMRHAGPRGTARMRAVSRSFDDVGRGAQREWLEDLRRSRATINAVMAGERERRMLDAVRLFERTARQRVPRAAPAGWRSGWAPGPGPLHAGYTEYQKVLPVDKRRALLVTRTVSPEAPTRLSMAVHGPRYEETQEYGWLELRAAADGGVWLHVHPTDGDVPPQHARLVRSFFDVAKALVNKYRRNQRLRA